LRVRHYKDGHAETPTLKFENPDPSDENLAVNSSDTFFAKNEKANLSMTEQAAAVEMSNALVAKYRDAT